MKGKTRTGLFVAHRLSVCLIVLAYSGNNSYAGQLQEADWFHPPKEFQRRSEESLNRPGVQPLVSMVLPNFEAVWIEPKSSSMIVMGRTILDAPQVRGLTKTSFLKSVDAIGKGYKLKLEAQRQGCQSSYRISNMANMIVLTVTASFPDVSDDTIHHRYAIFYRADYRLDVVVEASGRAMATFEPALTESVVDFLNELTRKYPSGIGFQG